MLHRALSLYRDAEGRGVDILEPEYFHASSSRSDLVQHAGMPYMELAQFCNPKHQDYDKATCQSYFPSAYIMEVYIGLHGLGAHSAKTKSPAQESRTSDCPVILSNLEQCIGVMHSLCSVLSTRDLSRG